MILDFGGQKQKPETQFREELRILATQIETINQQLASGTPGSGGLASGRALSDLNSKLTFLYEFLKTMQNDLHEESKSSMAQVSSSVNSTLQKNLGDIFASLQEIQKSIRNTNSGGSNPQDLADVKSTLKELVSVYREEVAVFKAQNDFLQKKLVDIERRLNSLEK